MCGQGFIRLMQMLVVPLVFCSLVCGSMAIGDTKRLGKVGVKTMVFYLLTTAIAISAAIFIASLINPGEGLNMGTMETAETVAVEKTKVADTILNIIPTNPIRSPGKWGNAAPDFICPYCWSNSGTQGENRADTVASFFSQFNDIMMDMTTGVMKLAPVGVFCLIARTFAGLGLDAFIPLLKYMAAVLLALAVQCFLVYQIFLKSVYRTEPH